MGQIPSKTRQVKQTSESWTASTCGRKGKACERGTEFSSGEVDVKKQVGSQKAAGIYQLGNYTYRSLGITFWMI